MTQSGKRYAPRDFLTALDEPETPASAQIEGLAKSDPADPDVILLDPGTGCRSWVRLPMAMIESVTALGQTTCGDHSHPYVRVELKAPTTPEGIAFAELAAAYRGMFAAAAHLAERPAAKVARLQSETADSSDWIWDCWRRCDDAWPNDWYRRWSCKLGC